MNDYKQGSSGKKFGSGQIKQTAKYKFKRYESSKDSARIADFFMSKTPLRLAAEVF